MDIDPIHLAWVTCFLCASAFWYLVSSMVRMRKLSLLHVGGTVLVLSNGIAIPFMLDSDTKSGYFSTEDSILVACVAIICLIIALLLTSLLPLYRSGWKSRTESFPDLRRIRLATLFIFFIAIAASFRFIVLGGAYAYIAQGLSQLTDVNAYYDNRAALSDALFVKGKGLFGALISLAVLFPIIICLSAYLASKTFKRFWAVYWTSILVSALLVSILAQRTMLMIAIVVPICAFMIIRQKNIIRINYSRLAFLILLGGAGFCVLVGFVFKVTNNVSFADGVQLGIQRTFGVPVGTSSFYYAVFPRVIPFRGWSRIFVMSNAQIAGDDVSFEDVSEQVTGYRFGANACFLATSYSAAGLPGIGVTVVVFCLLCYIIDRSLLKLEKQQNHLTLVCSLYSFVAIMNTPFAVAIFSYGFGATAFLLTLIFRGRNPARIRAVKSSVGKSPPEMVLRSAAVIQ